MKRFALLLLALAALFNSFDRTARGDILRWDNGQVIPGTQGITPGPGVQLAGLNLSFAELSMQMLMEASFQGAVLTNAKLDLATLADANFIDAQITGASFAGTDLHPFQLYDTASYQQQNLQGISFAGNDLFGWDFTDQNLTGANFSDTLVDGATFLGSNLTKEQLYSTESYERKNLELIDLAEHDLTGWDFNGQNLQLANLRSANLNGANLSNADLSNANLISTMVAGANFSGAIIQGAELSNVALSTDQFYSTASYQQKNLQGVVLLGHDLRGRDLSAQNLTGADVSFAMLAGTNFSGAIIENAAFHATVPGGFTKEQLYSTANYQAKNLRGVNLNENNLSGWDFSGLDLTKARFEESTLTGELRRRRDYGRAIRRDGRARLHEGAALQHRELSAKGPAGHLSADEQFDRMGFSWPGPAAFGVQRRRTRSGRLFAGRPAPGIRLQPCALDNLRNTIDPDGIIIGLSLAAGDELVVRDTLINANVGEAFQMADGSLLSFVLSRQGASPRMGVFTETEPVLNGTLRLAFLPGTNLTPLQGTTFDLFDWPMALGAANRFDTIDVPSGTLWDFTRLYTTGEVTFQAIPEPATILLLTAALCGLALRAVRRR